MVIDFECSGGFANLQLKYHVDTDELPKRLKEKILKMVAQSGFLDLESTDVPSDAATPPDVMAYRLSVSEGDKVKSISFNDVTAPESLHPLLARLQEFALDQKR